MRSFSKLGPVLYLPYSEFRKYIDNQYFASAYFWAEEDGYYQVITEAIGGIIHETNVQASSADGYDFETFFKELPPRLSTNQLATTPLLQNIFLTALGLEDGYHALESESWDTFASRISAVNVITESTNYNLWITTNNSFDVTEITSANIITNGFKNLLVNLNLEFLSSSRSLYIIIEDLDLTPSTFDVFIAGEGRS